MPRFEPKIWFGVVLKHNSDSTCYSLLLIITKLNNIFNGLKIKRIKLNDFNNVLFLNVSIKSRFQKNYKNTFQKCKNIM